MIKKIFCLFPFYSPLQLFAVVLVAQLLFLPKNLLAQEGEYELLEALPLAEGQEKIDILVKLSLKIHDKEKAKQFATEALAQAQAADYKDGIASAYIGLGSANKYILHTVFPTDSLDGIAKKYQTTVEEIMINSNMLSEGIFEGQILQIVTPASRAEAESYFLKALEIRKIQNFADGQVWTYQRLATLAKDGEDWSKAEKYYLEILEIREKDFKANEAKLTELKQSYLSLADFYFSRYQQEKTPSEKMFFLQKEEEMRSRFLDLAEKTTKDKVYFQIEILNTARFYWQQRKQIGKAEKYLKKAMAYSQEHPKQLQLPFAIVADFYKEQGKLYFRGKDFEQAEQFFKNYTQTNEKYFSKADSASLHEIANSYFLVADFYKVQGNTIGSDIYNLKGGYVRLKQNNLRTLKWLKARLEAINTSSSLIKNNTFGNEKLDYSFKDLAKELYKEDFKAILANLSAVNHLEIKKLMIEKTITLGAIIGENTQMITFYAQVLQSKNLDLDTKVDLNFKLAKVTENQGNTAQASNHYTQIIQLVENEKQQTVLHFYYLAKAYKASNNKQKAINFAWKALKNTAIPTQKTNKTEKAVFLSAEAMQEARDILAQLLRFDEVTDTTFIVHTVEKGEGLNDIQKMYDVDERCLREWNFLEGNELIEGMKIKVCKKVDWTRDRKENEALPPNAYIYHTVNQGESIISIAQRYNKTVQQLQAENSNSLTIITVGQKIWVGRYFMQCGCEK